jgi:hypothetical protein
MTDPASPEKRRFRPFFIIVLPLLWLLCMGAATWVVISTRQLLLAAPLAIVALGPARMMRWAMFWLSTPEERELLAPYVDREPLLRVLRDFYTQHRGAQPPPPPKREGGTSSSDS